MGLDTTHDAWHGAYSAFMRWRMEIARVAGIPLMLMEGYYECKPYIGEILARLAPQAHAFSQNEDGGFVATRDSLMAALADSEKRGDAGALCDSYMDLIEWLPIKWELLKPDPLHVLLNHSDCDGEIASVDCGPLADRLTELLPMLEGDWGGHIGNFRAKTEKFINGLRAAAVAGEALEFH